MSDEIIRKLVVASLMATDAIREHNPERKWVEKMVDFGFSMQLEPELVVMYVSAAIVVEKAMGISMGSNLGLAIAWISTRMIHNTISNIPNMRDWVMREIVIHGANMAPPDRAKLHSYIDLFRVTAFAANPNCNW